ncbi:MAG: hypothetical protein K2L80_05235 [Muribaculaceae bacterium]|nr:hypothetical protein [Muribaculaceae bacterium]MDE6331986.1 hypothetical protein [Muribaculaceae bacterium]
MRKYIISSLQAIFLVLTALGASSCGGDNTLQNLDTDVKMISSRLDSTAKGSPDAVNAFSMQLTDNAVALEAGITPGIFDLKLLEPGLAEFAVAAYLHVLNPDGNRNAEVADMINNMAKTKIPLEITLTQGENRFNQSLDAPRLKTLFKESLTNLNRSSAAANAASLTGSWAEKVFKTEGASDFECIYSTNRIVITVTYPNVAASPLKDVANPSPALKSMLADAAEKHYAEYGAMRPAVTQLMTDLGVKELRLTYKYSDGKPAPSVRLEWGSDL